MTDDVAQTALVFDARPAQRGAQDFRSAGEQIIAANKAVENSIGATTNRVVTSLSNQSRFLDGYARKWDPLTQAVRQAEREFEKLSQIAQGSGENAARAAGLLSTAQQRLITTQQALAQSTASMVAPTTAATDAVSRHYQASLQAGTAAQAELTQRLKVREAYQASLAPVQHLTAATKATGDTQQAVSNQVKLASYQWANLSQQLQDVFVGMTTGQRPMQVLLQQGPQITSAVGGMGAAFRALTSPIGLALSGVAAIAGGFLVGVSRANALEASLRQLGATLRATGNAGGFDAALLRTQAQAFARQPGVNRDVAQQATQALVGNPLITPDIFARALPLARDFATVTGTDIPAAAAKLAGALTGGYQAALALDKQLQFLSTSELDQIRNLEEQGRKTDAARVAIAALERQIKGAADAAVTPMAKATNDLGNAWDHLLDSLAKTSVIQGAKSALTSFLSQLAEIANPDQVKAREREIASLTGQLSELYAQLQRIQNSRFEGAVPGYRDAASRNILSQIIATGQNIAGVGPMSDEENNRQLMTALAQGADTAAGATGRLGDQAKKTKGEIHDLASEAKGFAEALDPARRQAEELLNKLQAFATVGNLGGIAAAITALRNLDTPENAAEQAARAAEIAGMHPRLRAGAEAMDRELRRVTTDPVSSVLSAFRQRGSAIQGYDAGQGVSSGISASKRIQEAEAEARIEAKFAAQIAEASKQGAAAVADMELRLKAAKKAQELYGEAAGQSADAVKRLADKLYALDKAAQHDKFVAEFRLATEEIERANTVLEAEVRLINATPEARAKEIAALKVRNDLLAKGESIGAEDYQRRLDAVTAQEEMNRKLEEAKKQQEAMAEPFKNAIQSLQSYIVDGLTGGFENAGQAIRGIWKRLMAELAVATIIRPIIVQPVVSLLGSLGLVPQSVTSQYGGGPLGSILGGGGASGSGGLADMLGLNRIFGGGSGGGMFGFLNNQITPTTYLPGYNEAAEIASLTGTPIPAGLTSGGQLGNLTWGGALAGIGSIGMGALNLAQGNTIGGAAGILGGGLGILGAAIPSLGFLGPIGMGIGLIGGLLGGLLKKKPKTPQAVSNIAFGAGGWTTAEAMRRGQQNLAGGTNTAGGAVGSSLDALASQFGLSFGPDTMGGWILNSIGKNTGNQWIVGLGGYGSYTPLPGVNGAGMAKDSASSISGIGSAEDAVQILAGLILRQGAMTGTIGGFTDTQRQIFSQKTFDDLEEIKKAFDFSRVYDDIKRGSENITAAEKSVRDLNEQFRALSAQAKDYGLDVGIIAQRQQEAINKLATDANDEIRRRSLGMTPEGQLQLALEDFDKARDAWIKNAEFINQTVTGTLVDIAAAEEQFGKERLQIIEQANEQASSALKDIWKRLSYGDLSGASPMTTLAGARGTYEATLAQANAGSLTARGNLAGAVQDYIAAQLRYTGNDSQFEAVRLKLLADIAPYVADNSNFLTSANDNITEASNLMLSQQYQIQNLTTALAESRQQFADAMTQITNLTQQVSRLVALLPAG